MWHLSSNDAKEYAAALVAASAVGVTWWKRGFGLWTVHVKRRDATRAKSKAQAAYLARLDSRGDTILAEVQSLAESVKQVQYQVLPNGGHNLRGEVTSTRVEVDTVIIGLDSLRRDVSVEQAARRASNAGATREVSVDAQGRELCSYVSPEWTRITGMTREDTDNRGWLRAVHPDDRERIERLSAICTASHDVFNAEYIVRNVLDHKMCTPVEHTRTLICDVNKTVYAWISVYRVTYGVAGDTSHAEYLARVEERGVAILEKVNALAGKVEEVQYQVLPNGGHNLRGEVTSTRVEVDAVKVGLDSLRITVNSEQAARRGTNTAAVWEGRVDADGTVTCAYVSPEWMRLTGLAKEDTDNEGWMRCVHPMDKERIKAAAQYASDHGTIFAEEYAIRHASNFTITPVQCISTPNQDSHGTIHSWIAILRPTVGIPSAAG